MQIQERIAAKRQALEELKGHPMCCEVYDEGDKLVIVFPCMVQGLGGIRVWNTAAGIRVGLERCEKAWKDSML